MTEEFKLIPVHTIKTVRAVKGLTIPIPPEGKFEETQCSTKNLIRIHKNALYSASVRLESNYLWIIIPGGKVDQQILLNKKYFIELGL